MGVFFTFFLIFILLLVYMKCFFMGQIKQNGNFQRRKFPVIQWTRPYLPLINGFITLLKLRTEGVKVADVIENYGLSAELDIPYVKGILTRDPNLLQKLLGSTNPGHLNKPKSMYEALFTSHMKNGILVSDVSVWTPHRKAVSCSFAYKSFQTYLKFINAAAQNIVESACAATANNCYRKIGNAEMKKLIDKHVVKIITQIIIGSENFNYLDQEINEFVENLQRAKEITSERFVHPMQMIPFIWRLHPNKRKLDYYIGQCTKFSCKMTDNYRQKSLTNTIKVKQPIQCNKCGLIECKYGGGSETGNELGLKPFECMIEQMIKAGFKNNEINDEVNTFLAAGHETILSALDMIIFHLAANNKHQEICRSEADDLFDAKKIQTIKGFSLSDVSKLEYLERCILETLRITPIVPAFIRHLDIPLEVEKNCFIEAGYSIFVSVWSLHRNSDIYPNPTEFDPDRFLPENVKERHPFSFIPFSFGPRNCIGYKVALLEMKVIMAWILRHFELTTTDKLDDVKLLFDTALKPERMYNITFKKRAES